MLRRTGAPPSSTVSLYANAALQQLDRVGPNPLADREFSKFIVGDARARELGNLERALSDALTGVTTGRGHEDEWGPIVSRTIGEFHELRGLNRRRLGRLTRHLPHRARRWSDLDEAGVRSEALHLDRLSLSRINSLHDMLGVTPTGGAAVRSDLRIRWIRRRIRRAARQYREGVALVAGVVSSRGQHYTSDHTQRDRRQQLETQAAWIAATQIVDRATGESRPMAAVAARAQENRLWEWLAVTQGVEELAVERGLTPLFLTMTAAPEYHPCPISGDRDQWAGASPMESHQWLAQQWARLRARLAKHEIPHLFIRAAEPHRDGCAHWHVMLWIPRWAIGESRRALHQLFAHSEHALQVRDFTLERSKSGRQASPSSYLLKYLQKGLSSENRVDAWRSTWGVRAIQAGGLPASARTMWRMARSIEPDNAPTWAVGAVVAARGNDFAEFVREIERNEIMAATEKTHLPGDEQGMYYTVVRYMGLRSGIDVLVTQHTQHDLITDFSKKSEVTVIHSYPSGGHDTTPIFTYQTKQNSNCQVGDPPDDPCFSARSIDNG